MKLRLLFQAKWAARFSDELYPGYVEARITKDVIGWHYRRGTMMSFAGFGRRVIWEPRVLCFIKAGIDLLRRERQLSYAIHDSPITSHRPTP
jgi:hypothetical protein